MRTVLSFVLLVVALVGVAGRPADARTWTDRTGRRVEAELVGFADGQVKIKRASDGMIFSWPLERFSDADRAFVGSQTRGDSSPTADARPSAAKPGTPEPSAATGIVPPKGLTDSVQAAVKLMVHNTEAIAALSDEQLALAISQEHRAFMAETAQAAAERRVRETEATATLTEGQLVLIGWQEYREVMSQSPKVIAERRFKDAQVLATFDDNAVASLRAKIHAEFMRKTPSELGTERLEAARVLARLSDGELASMRASEHSTFMRQTAQEIAAGWLKAGKLPAEIRK